MILEEDARGEDLTEGENYFVSMTDMMVGMLFIFIILLMSFALLFRHQTDQQVGKIEVAEEVGRKLDELESRISRRLADIRKANQARLSLLRELEHQLAREGLVVQVVESSGILRLTEDAVRFPFNSAALADEAKMNVGKIAQALARVLPAYAACPKAQTISGCRANQQSTVETVFIEGHTDERGQDDPNWILSAQRAASTYRELASVAPELRRIFNRRDEEILSISGYSSTRPVDTGRTPSAYAKNRRIDLRFVMDTDTSAGLEEISSLLQGMRKAIRDLKGSP